MLYINNDLPNTTKLCKYILHADDSSLSIAFPSNEIDCYADIINFELKNIDLWLSLNRILLNEIKSNYIIFSYRNLLRISPIYIGRHEIKPINSTKFLGIYIDRNLVFRDHVSHISSKVARSLGVLHKLRICLPREILITLYNSLILPYLTYAIEVWHGAFLNVTERVFVLQKSLFVLHMH